MPHSMIWRRSPCSKIIDFFVDVSCNILTRVDFVQQKKEVLDAF